MRLTLGGELETHGIAGVPLEQGGLLFGADDVERGRDQVGQVCDQAGMPWRLLWEANPSGDRFRAVAVQRVSNAAERPDQGHPRSLAPGAGRLYRDARRTTNEGGSPAAGASASSIRSLARAGRRTTITVPEAACRFGSTRMLPPCASTMARVM